MKRIADEKIQDFETEHIQKIREIASECVVLLKNDGVLPLRGPGKIGLYGSGARRTIKGGTGSGDVNVRHFVTAEESLLNAGFEITSADWLNGYEAVITKTRSAWTKEIRDEAKAYGISPIMLSMGRVMPEPEYELPLDGTDESVDTAIYILSRISGEGSDRRAVAGDIDLSETEIRDILALNEKYEKFVLVLNVGGMVNLAPVADVKSILLLGQLGTATGDVLADVLLGKRTPSGKLAMTWAPIEQYPSTEGFGDPDDTVYREGVYVGYRYFDTARVTPAWPFGYGLSYTEFQIEVKRFCADEKTVKVTVSVKNVGQHSGKEVVQVYASAPAGELDRPYQELMAFAKTGELLPQEEQEITLAFDVAAMAGYFEDSAEYVLEAGDYRIRVGNSSANTKVCGIVRLDRDAVVRRVRNICGRYEHQDRIVPGDLSAGKENAEALQNAEVVEIKAEQISAVETFYQKTPRYPSGGLQADWQDVVSGEKSIDEFLMGLDEKQLALLCVGNYGDGDAQSVIGCACTTVAGGAGETTHQLRALHLDAVSMADGPAGLRLSKEYQLADGKIIPCDNSLAAMYADFLEAEELQMMAAQAVPEGMDETKYYQFCTAIPTGTALAQSFSESAAEACGDIVGDEMERFGVALWLAPALNIQRSPLCGRNFEYYSEDPLVSGKMAAAVTRGVQKHPGCGTVAKHFAANNQETNRYASNSVVSERALREIYLKGFEICVRESAPEAIMTSYNLVNGEHACSNYDILTSVLRDEWGYQGIVMTDWYVTTDLMRNPSSKYPSASAAGCVKAGNNLIMPGTDGDVEDILKALKEESHPYHLSMDELRACAKGVLETIRRLGSSI
ncbi:MAG: glycoside hydrolase family 3 C-terminal domain-containing protein [Clostridiales bacterium]|nr:glycoside hydrolase family 3 C-terminal domain-containing protein [Clostridiales bacterium]